EIGLERPRERVRQVAPVAARERVIEAALALERGGGALKAVRGERGRPHAVARGLRLREVGVARAGALALDQATREARSEPEHAIASVSAWCTSAFAWSTTAGGRSSTRNPATKAPSVTASGIRVIGHLGVARDASAAGRHRLVQPQKRAHLVDRLLEQVLRL